MSDSSTSYSELHPIWGGTEDGFFFDDVSPGLLLPGEEVLPELDELLHNSIVHVTEQPEGESDNILKKLEKEFRQALIWGSQKLQVSSPASVKVHRFTENSFDFDKLKEQVESATVTHCIFDTPALIQKVFSELEIKEEDMLHSAYPERKNVLTLLASEERGHDSRRRLPDLLVQDIYQAGLDTLF
ncbi:hypothetical protein C9426_28080 [Serratia sp. S1B]|nr:hypothetical protein C9426_28080 [Serratia sp. S1B]